MRVQIKDQITINAPASKVWRVIAHEFDKIGEWSTFISSSAPLHDAPAPSGAHCSGRVCYSIGSDPVEEEFTYYDEAGMRFGYRGRGKLPWPFRNAENNWSVRKLGKNLSEVSFRAEVDTVGPVSGMVLSLFKPVVRKFLSPLTELKYYVEYGRPHPRKLKAQQKQLQKASAHIP